MTQQFVVVRGQIENGKKVVAKYGMPYMPRNGEEQERLLSAGVIAPALGVVPDWADDDESEAGGIAGEGQPLPPASEDEPDAPEAVATDGRPAVPTDTDAKKPTPNKRPRK